MFVQAEDFVAVEHECILKSNISVCERMRVYVDSGCIQIPSYFIRMYVKAMESMLINTSGRSDWVRMGRLF